MDLKLTDDVELLKKCYGVNVDVLRPFSMNAENFKDSFRKMEKSVFRFYIISILVFTLLGVLGVYVYKVEPLLAAFFLFLSTFMNFHNFFNFSARLRGVGAARFVAQKHDLI